MRWNDKLSLTRITYHISIYTNILFVIIELIQQKRLNTFTIAIGIENIRKYFLMITQRCSSSKYLYTKTILIFFLCKLIWHHHIASSCVREPQRLKRGTSSIMWCIHDRKCNCECSYVMFTLSPWFSDDLYEYKPLTWSHFKYQICIDLVL